LKITFLGTGTSQGVPVIACTCPVCQSDDAQDKRLRSSILLSYNEKNVVIDTGPDFRCQMLREQVNHLEAVLMTHAHKDHIAGLDDVRAYNYQQQQSIPVYSTKATHEALRREFYYAFSEAKYPGIPQLELEEVVAGNSFELFGKRILPIEVMHYKMPVLGFRIDDFAYVTDAKTISEESLMQLEGVKVLVLNALQQEPHISHLTLSEAVDVVEKLQPEMTYLTHISHRFGTHAAIEALLPVNIKVGYDGLTLFL